MTTWKRRERQVAAILGGKRTGPTGRDDVDVQHPLVAVEVKARKALPVWAMQCLEQARSARSAGGKPPIAVLIGRGMRIDDGLVVITVRDFRDLFGPIQERHDQGTDADSPVLAGLPVPR